MAAQHHEKIDPDSKLILSLDIGTSSARAFLYTPGGVRLPGIGARQEYQPVAGSDGSVVLDPDLLLETVWSLIDQVLEQAGQAASQIAGVGTDTFVTSTIGLDKSGRPVTPILTYADTRSAPDAAALRKRLDENEIYQRTGVPFHPGYWPARIVWMARTQPEVFSRIQRWVTVGEYMVLKLFGDAAISNSAAAWTGLEDIRRCDWDHTLLAELPTRPDQFSPVVDRDFTWRGPRAEFASRWPALKQAAWLPALGDGAASNIGSGCTSPGKVAVVVGTSSAVRAALEGPVPEIPYGLWCYRVDSHRPLLGGAMNEGGAIYAWTRRMFNWQGVENLEQAAAALPPDSHGLTFLPLLAGERSPGWRGDARGGIYGLTMATTPIDILRAGMESVCMRIGLIYRLLRPALPGDPLVVASGGAMENSPAWVQILSDVLGRPVTLTRYDEASARGTALLAAYSLGLITSLAADGPVGKVYEPDPGRYQVYQEAARRQQEFYKKMVADEPGAVQPNPGDNGG